MFVIIEGHYIDSRCHALMSMESSPAVEELLHVSWQAKPLQLTTTELVPVW